jgi:micrococcal nuclease
VVALVAVAVAAAGCGRSSPPSAGAGADGESVAVARVIDGDTIAITRDGHEVRVRLIGIDTPETKKPNTPVQCFGKEASARTEALLPPGTPVRLVYDVERLDTYGRDLAYVFRQDDGLFVNLSLVTDGFAVIDTFPPNVAHVDAFTAAARDARQQARGLWRSCPSDHRSDASR